MLPEIRLHIESGSNAEMNERFVGNLVSFIKSHLRTRGTRHAEDQNVLNALLVAVVDSNVIEDKLINAVAKVFDVRWEAVKRAVLRRAKLDDEEAAPSSDGIWTRVPRSVRIDKYELPGFYEFCHDETFFRFSSRRSEPLREHTAFRAFKVRAHTRSRPQDH